VAANCFVDSISNSESRKHKRNIQIEVKKPIINNSTIIEVVAMRPPYLNTQQANGE
jgi:hypothetical protein